MRIEILFHVRAVGKKRQREGRGILLFSRRIDPPNGGKRVNQRIVKRVYRPVSFAFDFSEQ